MRKVTHLSRKFKIYLIYVNNSNVAVHTYASDIPSLQTVTFVLLEDIL